MKRFYFYSISVFVLILLGTVHHASAQKATVKGKVASEGEPLVGATVAVVGTTNGTTSNVDGEYSLKLEPGEHDIAVSFVGYTEMRKTVEIEAGEVTVLNFNLNSGVYVDQVVVVGSRAEPRTQLETAVPIDVISAKTITSSSQGNVSSILQYAAPSFHSTPQTISDGTDHIDPATLRGLGPDQVLVLVNGKRRHNSSLINVNGTVGRGTVGTDLNAIPAAAIEKVEILRDGAAAQYGSDAIAGVINVILKENTQLATVNARAGITAEGDGEEVQVNSNFGFDIGERGGYVNATIDVLQRGSSNRSGDYTGSVFGDSLNIGGRIYSDNNPEDLAAFYEQTPFDGQRVMEIGNSAVRNAGLGINTALPLTGEAELYGNMLFNYRNGKARGFYRFPGATSRVVPEIYPFGFSPEIHSDIMDNAFTIGLRGKLGEWNLDVSQTRGQNSFDFTVKNSNNASLGTASPTEAYAGGFAYSQNTSNVDFSRSKYFANFKLNTAFGVEFRLENYQIYAGEEASWVNGGAVNSNGAAGSAGIQVFPGFQPQNELDKYRNNLGGYVDIEGELNKKLLIGLAARMESYSDFGENLTGKIAGRYKLTDDYTVRAALSTGFRAPSLHQVYFNNLSTQFIDVDGTLTPFQVGTFNNVSTVTKAFGIEALRPETSQNLSLGLTGRIAPNFSLTIDGYRIRIEDRIVLSGRFREGYEDILLPLGAGAAQFFTNAVSTTTMGIDAVASYRLSLGNAHSLDLTLAGNFTNTEVDKDDAGNAIINTSEILDGQESVLFDREEISRLEVAQPRQKIVFTANYERAKLSALLRATYFGEVLYRHPSNSELDEDFSPRVIPDIELAYAFSKNLRWTIGAHNFTNTFPDPHELDANISSGRFIYSRRVMQFGLRGLFAYTKLGLTF